MLIAKWVYETTNGEILNSSDILCPFVIYKRSKRWNRFILLPSESQREISDIILFASEKGITSCCIEKHPVMYKKILSFLNAENEHNITVSNSEEMAEIRDIVCKEIIKFFKM